MLYIDEEERAAVGLHRRTRPFPQAYRVTDSGLLKVRRQVPRCSNTAIPHLSCLTLTVFSSCHCMKRSLQDKLKAANERK